MSKYINFIDLHHLKVKMKKIVFSVVQNIPRKMVKKVKNSFINAMIANVNLLVAPELIEANYGMNMLEENRLMPNWQIVIIAQ